MGNGELETAASQIVARLDHYLPELNTSMMDGRLQDGVLKHPILRSLNVPPSDQAARRRCVKTIARAVAAATPVLPLILQDHARSEFKNNNKNERSGLSGTSTAARVYNHSMNGKYRPLNVPQLSMETETRLLNYITDLSEKEPMIRFWMNHHIEYQKSKASDSAGVPGPSKKRRLSATGSPSSHNQAITESTLDLYLRLKISQDILEDLGDRVQGVCCMVFWECWDEIYIALAGIAGDDVVDQADAGRLFRVSGDAALYIDNRNAQKKRKIAEQQRLSIIAEEDNTFNLGNSNGIVGSSSLYPFVTDDMFKYNTSTSANLVGLNHSVSSSSPGLSASPDSLITDDSKDSSIETGVSSSNHNLQLIDESELGFVMDDEFLRFEGNNSLSRDKSRKEMMDVFTTLHDVGDLLKSRASSSTNLKNLKNMPLLDLRARIKMMEEGQSGIEDGHNASSQIVW